MLGNKLFYSLLCTFVDGTAFCGTLNKWGGQEPIFRKKRRISLKLKFDKFIEITSECLLRWLDIMDIVNYNILDSWSIDVRAGIDLRLLQIA